MYSLLVSEGVIGEIRFLLEGSGSSFFSSGFSSGSGSSCSFSLESLEMVLDKV